jgi:hypothetical protein
MQNVLAQSSRPGDDRANVSGNPHSGPHTASEFFNTAAFSVNAPLTFGDAGCNIVNGRGLLTSISL